jgi:hypothetical protein
LYAFNGRNLFAFISSAILLWTRTPSFLSYPVIILL